ARNMAWVSATMTRIKRPPPLSGPEPRLSCVLTGVLSIQFLRSLDLILIDHDAYTATSSIFKATHHAAAAVELHIAPRTDHFGRKHDREIHHRPDWHIRFHREQHSIRRNVFRLGEECSALRLDRRRQMQRKPRRTLHFFVMGRIVL